MFSQRIEVDFSTSCAEAIGLQKSNLQWRRYWGYFLDGVYIEAAKKVAGIEQETIEKVRQFDEAFAAGTFAAIATKYRLVHWNPEHKQTKTVIPLTGSDKAVVSFNRSTSTMDKETREPNISFGEGLFAYHFSSGSVEDGDFAKAVKSVKDYATAALKDL